MKASKKILEMPFQAKTVTVVFGGNKWWQPMKNSIVFVRQTSDRHNCQSEKRVSQMMSIELILSSVRSELHSKRVEWELRTNARERKSWGEKCVTWCEAKNQYMRPSTKRNFPHCDSSRWWKWTSALFH